MKRIAKSEPLRLRGTLGTGFLLLGTLSAMTLAGTSGCDAVAQLNFSDRTFETPHSAGILPVGDSAEACSGSGGDAVLRFVLLDGDGLPISNKSQLNNRTVNLDANSIEFSSTQLYDFPDDPACGGNSTTCASCPGTGYNAEANLCILESTTINPKSSPTFVSSVSQTQALAILVENTASMSGQLPAVIDTYFPDYSNAGGEPIPDGRAEDVGVGTGSTYKGANPQRASDGDSRRLSVVQEMITTSFQAVQRRAETDEGVQSFLGVWTFDESGLQVSDSLMPGARDSNPNFWSSNANSAGTAASNLSNNVTPTNREAAVFRALSDLLDDDDKLKAFPANTEKYVIVVVDGPDDFRTIQPQEIIEKAQAQGVKIFFIQLDPAVEIKDLSGTPLLPDSTRYVAGQDTPCADDSSCKNFEACRPVTAFGSFAGGEVQFPQGKIFVNDTPSEGRQTYCSIQRDANGRIGPINDYAQIACATGGGYIRVDSLRASDNFSGRLSWMPAVMDGLWELPVESGAFGGGSLVDGDGYAFDSTITFNAGERSKQYRLGGFEAPRGILFEK